MLAVYCYILRRFGTDLLALAPRVSSLSLGAEDPHPLPFHKRLCYRMQYFLNTAHVSAVRISEWRLKSSFSWREPHSWRDLNLGINMTSGIYRTSDEFLMHDVKTNFLFLCVSAAHLMQRFKAWSPLPISVGVPQGLVCVLLCSM